MVWPRTAYIGRDLLAHRSDGVEWAVRLAQV